MLEFANFGGGEADDHLALALRERVLYGLLRIDFWLRSKLIVMAECLLRHRCR